ncbi:MAG TPA: lytic transglycosylase domain-containing protein [Bryobacteraceae bacterium]|nr:lytic transglycosylase domain-containing protein [Bryobacteraceae bacterium]
MTTPNCSVATIPVRSYSALPLALCAALLAAGAAAPQSRPASKTASKSPAKPAAKAAVAPPATLAALVRAYRESPTPARRAAVASWGASHSKDRPAAELALGVAAYGQRDYASAIAALRQAQGLPQIADYTAYYLAAARVESQDFGGIVKDLAIVHDSAMASPLAARARLLEARALMGATPADAARLLEQHSAELPQPEGDTILGEALQNAGDLAGAVEIWQRIYCQYVTGDGAARAATALAALRNAMGASYPALSTRQMLRHADRLMEAREFAQARAEYRALAERASGLDRDTARVRLGAVDYLAGKSPTAAVYLRPLEVAAAEAEAERLYYLVECARRIDDDRELKQALKRLEDQPAKSSSWRLKALVAGANYFLISNRPDEYLPLYRAVYQDFPDDPAAGLSHWKVTFDAYLHRRSEAVPLLREQLVRYPHNANVGAALYFLGRAAEERKDFPEAAACYRHLVKLFENYYYAMLARDRLRRPELHSVAASPQACTFLAGLGLPVAQPIPLEPARETTLRIERSRVLRAAGLSDLADSELRFGARSGGQPALLGMEAAGAADSPAMALHLLKVMAPDHLAIPLASAPRRFWELLYPLPYRAEVFADARERDLDPYLVAGLIRQESEFNPAAVSSAKAYGLMQVLPVTGRRYARMAGVPGFSIAGLKQPAMNLKIGTFVLRQMLDASGGHVEHTLAAYNAGPMRMAEWLAWNSPQEPAEFVESIPFTETREYVQAVLRNADMYRRLYP